MYDPLLTQRVLLVKNYLYTMNTMLLRFNATGRKFLCLTSNPGLVDEFDDHKHFVAGEIYVEAMYDSDRENHIEEDEDVILLLTKEGLALYVDARYFYLLQDKVNELVLLPICLN